MRPLITAILVAALAPAAPVPKDAKKADDKDLLLGTWKTVTENGKDGSGVITHTWEFGKDDHLSQQYGGNGGKLGPQEGVSNWTWKLDTTVTPKKLTWVSTKDPLDKWESAYELDGDTLRVVIVYKGTPWPEKVAAGKGLYLYELKRDTPKK